MVVSLTSRGIGRRGLLWTNWWFWEGHHQNFCFVRTRMSRTFISRGRRAIRIGLPAFDLRKRSGKEEANHWLTEEVLGRRTFNLQKALSPMLESGISSASLWNASRLFTIWELLELKVSFQSHWISTWHWLTWWRYYNRDGHTVVTVESWFWPTNFSLLGSKGQNKVPFWLVEAALGPPNNESVQKDF